MYRLGDHIDHSGQREIKWCERYRIAAVEQIHSDLQRRNEQWTDQILINTTGNSAFDDFIRIVQLNIDLLKVQFKNLLFLNNPIYLLLFFVSFY